MACALGEGYFGYVAGVLLTHSRSSQHGPGTRGPSQGKLRPALPIAWAYLGLGETAAGFQCLEMALAERDPFLASVMVFPAYDAIRD